jgi:hypothetical protein
LQAAATEDQLAAEKAALTLVPLHDLVEQSLI